MIIPTVSDAIELDRPAVPLALYAQRIGYSECAFFNVVRATDPPSTKSQKPTWIKSERDQVAYYLAEAQAEIEAVIRFPLTRRWIVNEYQPWSYPLLASWCKVVAGGIKGESDIEAGSAVDHTDDPAVIGPIATTVTDEDEVRVFYPDTDTEINPSNITIDGGNVTIEIPRCRLQTLESQADNDAASYTDTGVGGAFLQTVDVKRIYNDTSTQGTLVWPPSRRSSAYCDENTQDACIYVSDAEIGELEVAPATYSGGSWTRQSFSQCCWRPEGVRLNYYAGAATVTRQMEDAIIRLAHAKMPFSPCNCDPPLWMWQHDRIIPDALTRERANCPFGMSNGAWIAWRFAQTARIVRAGIL